MQFAWGMFTKSGTARRIGTALAATFAIAALSSFKDRPVDPSLLAAPEYRPDLWNDVSNENLALFYTRHSRLVEKIARLAAEQDKENAAYLFTRSAHTNMEKAYSAIRTLADQSKQDNNQLTFSLSAFYALPVYEIASALSDVREMYRPKFVQPFNNCLSYSVDDRDIGRDEKKDYAAMPGERTLGLEAATLVTPYRRADYAAFVRQTIRGNESDGMIFTGREMQSRAGYYRVALFMRPARHDTENIYEGHEFHYVRQNRDGTWSHKYGGLNVIDTDYGGRKITDPEKADMGAYNFTGYFLVPQGGLDVGPPEEKATKPGTRPAFSNGDIVVVALRHP